MSDFPQTWFRPSRYGSLSVSVDSLVVHRETEHTIWVQERGWAGTPLQTNRDGTPKLRKQLKDGATRSEREAWEAIVADKDREAQRLQDERSRVMGQRAEALRRIAALPKDSE